MRKKRITSGLASIDFKLGHIATTGYENRDKLVIATDEIKRLHNSVLAFEKYCAGRMKLDAEASGKEAARILTALQAAGRRFDAIIGLLNSLDCQVRNLDAKVSNADIRLTTILGILKPTTARKVSNGKKKAARRK